MKNLFFIITAFALSMVSAIGPSAKANNTTPTTIVIEKAGTLDSLLSQESMDTITSLILKGEINGDDVQVLRYMTGRDKDGEVSNGMLSELDMSEVQIKSGGTYSTGSIQTEGQIPQGMFTRCQSLKKIILPNLCTGIEGGAFLECQYLEEVKIPENCTFIGSDAFSGCKSLSSIDIPSSVTAIGNYAFYNSNLQSITFVGDCHLSKIDQGCFRETALTTFTLPTQIKTISEAAFLQCKFLREFVIPEGSELRSIKQDAFRDCSNLSTLRISKDSKLVSIEENALFSCPLTSLYIPKYLTLFNSPWNTSNTKSVIIHPENQNFVNIDSIIYGRQNKNVVYLPKDIEGTIHIPEFISKITERMFCDMKKVSAIILPTTLTAIDNRAFAGCDGLQRIISLNDNAPLLDASSFEGMPVENITLYVPASSVDTYKSNGWNVFRKIEAIPTEPLMKLSKQEVSAFLTSCQRSKTISLNAEILTEEGMYEGVINWQSSNTDVATVNEAGEVTVKAEGKATIIASITYKGKVYSTTCNLQAIDITLHPNAYFVEAGRLKDIIPEEEKYNITTLNLYGEINGDDVAFIRDMAGIDSDLKTTEGKLEVLDLTNVRVVEGGNYRSKYGYEVTPTFTAICEINAMTSTDRFGEAPFSYCPTLKEVHLPATLKTIPIACFNSCTNLQKVQIPNSITEIGELAFYDRLVPGETMGETMILDSITMPFHLDSIGNKAFHAVGTVHLLDTIPAQLDKENPAILGEGGCVIVPAKVLDAYRNAEGWKTFYQQIIPDDAILEAEVTAEAREGGSGLLTALGEKRAAWTRSLTIHGTINSWDIIFIRNKMPFLCKLDMSDARIVASPKEYWTGCHTENNRIGENAFRDMKNLREVSLPKILKYIGVSAFENCLRLRSIDIPQGVNTIDDVAFGNCTSLKNVRSHEGLMSIGERVFNNTGVETISLPKSLRSIGYSTFWGCRCLKNIVLPDAVRRIEKMTFENCENLQSIILPAQLNVIEHWAFKNCNKLTEIHIPPMVETIGSGVFEDCTNLKDLYVYIANANDISINMNTFSCWNTATLHVPSFGYSLYYWNTQWSQFYRMENFDEEYKSFYTKNALVLNNETGKIDGTPDAVIYENGGLVVNEDVKQDINNIEMKSDGEGNSATVIPEKETSIQAKHAQITINVTGNQWHFFCFPFDIPLDSVQYQGDYVWRQYDGAARSRREGGWQNLPANETTLHAGRGYIFQGTNSGELKMAVDNPEFSANDVKTGLEVHPSEKAADASWNFVGNPYTSYYNIDSLAYEAPITVWTGNGYEAYRPGDDDYSFAPYTAFFVQTPEENQELGFGAGGRQTKEGAEQQVQEAKARRARRAANPARTLINLTIAHTDAEEDGYIDRTRIVFNEQKSTGYEASCDAAKFFSAGRAVEIFTTDGEGNKYAINERPVADGKVTLGINCHKAGTYRLAALNMGNGLYLQDAKTGEMHSLEEPCELMLDKGETTARFMILTEGAATSVKEIHTEAGKTGDAYDLSGRHVNVQTHKGVMVSKGTKVLK